MLLNCDMGESFGNYTIGADSEVMAYVDMANIACGMHASDPDVMNQTVALAKKHSTMVGAHPGYPDLQGFGRRNIGLTVSECENTMLYQVGALKAFTDLHGVDLEYIKPHGALYNTMMKDENILRAAMKVAGLTGTKLMILATEKWQEHQKMAQEYGTELFLEGFVDRGYEDDGSLVNRQKPNALIGKDEMLERVETCCQNKPIVSVNGKELSFPVHSLCVHGDGEGVSLIKDFKNIIDRYGK